MELKRVTPPDIGKIDTTPQVMDIPPEEAEVRRLQQLLFEQQEQVAETHRLLERARKEQHKMNLLEMKKNGMPIDEAMLKRLL